MINVTFYAFVVMVFSIVMTIISNTSIKNDEAFVVIFVVGIIVFATWGGILINLILTTIRNYIEKKEEIIEWGEKKESYKKQLEQYRKETMYSVVFENIQSFEERVIKDITDSKLLATVVDKDGGYTSLVKTYANRIENFLNSIHSCDRVIAELERDTKTMRKDRFGYGFFIPKEN